MPAALDVELHPGRISGLGHLVRGPVRVPRPGMGRVVGEQVCVLTQLDADRGQGFPYLIQVAHDQRAGFRVDGEPAVLVGLGVLADALTTTHDVVEGDVHRATVHDVVEGDVHRATVEVDVADLQAAQLAATHAGDDDQPQVQAQGGAVRAGLGDHLGHVFR